MYRDTDWNVKVYNADFYPYNGTFNLEYLLSEGFQNYLSNLRNTDAKIWHEIRDKLHSQNPDVIGITAKTQNFGAVRIVARIAKELNPRVKLIVGGPHASMAREQLLECSDIDIVAFGEGEDTLVELLSAIKNGDSLNGIAGTIARENGEIIINPARPLIENLDELVFPHQFADKILIDYEQYPKWAFAGIFATRGCPFGCTFCGSKNIWSRKARFRSAQNVANEVKLLQELGVKEFRFDDDTFGISRKYITELCGSIKAVVPGMNWHSEIHTNLVDDETIGMMRDAGCSLIQIGIESGSNKMLKIIKKGCTIESSLEACKTIKKHGIQLQTFFIVGFPDETEETLLETKQAIEKVEADYLIYSIFTPYPGTEDFDKCKEYGLVDDDFDVTVFNHQSPENCFCKNIDPVRFRELISEIEKMVDKMNVNWYYRAINKLIKLMPRKLRYRISDSRFMDSLRRIKRIYVG